LSLLAEETRAAEQTSLPRTASGTANSAGNVTGLLVLPPLHCFVDGKAHASRPERSRRREHTRGCGSRLIGPRVLLVRSEHTEASALDSSTTASFLLALKRRTTLDFSKAALHTHFCLGKRLLRVRCTKLRDTPGSFDPLLEQLLVGGRSLRRFLQRRFTSSVKLTRVAGAVHHQCKLSKITWVDARR
jgi:hypothetical protein